MTEEFHPDRLTQMLTELKCSVDHQAMRAHEWQKAANTFRGESLSVQAKILDQTTLHNGRLEKGELRMKAIEDSIKDDVVKWKDIMINSKNWKFYLLVVAVLMGSKLGADGIKELILGISQLR